MEAPDPEVQRMEAVPLPFFVKPAGPGNRRWVGVFELSRGIFFTGILHWQLRL